MKTFSFFLISFTFVTAVVFGQSNDEIEIRQLENALTELIKKFKGEAHLYAKNLTTGEIIDMNGISTHKAASEAKLYILLD